MLDVVSHLRCSLIYVMRSAFELNLLASSLGLKASLKPRFFEPLGESVSMIELTELYAKYTGKILIIIGLSVRRPFTERFGRLGRVIELTESSGTCCHQRWPYF